MRALLAIFALWTFATQAAQAGNDLVLPTIAFSATAVHESGAFRSKEIIHYANGKLRIDRPNGFASTILDLTTQTQCLLMANHTYIVLPMDGELFRRFFARSIDASGSRKLGGQRIDGLDTTKYQFGDDGALEAAGSYWLTNTGIMVRREYDDGVHGQYRHHLEYLTNISPGEQPASLFTIPPGSRVAK